MTPLFTEMSRCTKALTSQSSAMVCFCLLLRCFVFVVLLFSFGSCVLQTKLGESVFGRQLKEFLAMAKEVKVSVRLPSLLVSALLGSCLLIVVYL